MVITVSSQTSQNQQVGRDDSMYVYHSLPHFQSLSYCVRMLVSNLGSDVLLFIHFFSIREMRTRLLLQTRLEHSKTNQCVSHRGTLPKGPFL